MTTIHIRNATLQYQHTPLFSDLNLTLPQGKCVCVLGPSGIGKSSLLRFVANLLKQSKHKHDADIVSGDIITDNHLKLKHQLAYMAQTDCLLPWLTTFENIVLGFRLRKQPIDKNKALALLAAVGLSNAINQYPNALSGGMRQRVALARTLMEDKSIILMDEPFASLDAITKFELQDLCARLLQNKTVFLVTHDPMEALRLGDHIYVMSGKPAKLQECIQLDSPKPRALTDLSGLQAELMQQLQLAKENFA